MFYVFRYHTQERNTFVSQVRSLTGSPWAPLPRLTRRSLRFSTGPFLAPLPRSASLRGASADPCGVYDGRIEQFYIVRFRQKDLWEEYPFDNDTLQTECPDHWLEPIGN
jgi:hypothetical protein